MKRVSILTDCHHRLFPSHWGKSQFEEHSILLWLVMFSKACASLGFTSSSESKQTSDAGIKLRDVKWKAVVCCSGLIAAMTLLFFKVSRFFLFVIFACLVISPNFPIIMHRSIWPWEDHVLEGSLNSRVNKWPLQPLCHPWLHIQLPHSSQSSSHEYCC